MVLESDLDQVYIYQDSIAHKVNLTLGFSSGNDVEVLSGLKEGDLVVTAGQDGLREGLPIRIPDLERMADSSTGGAQMSSTRSAASFGQGDSNFSSIDPDRFKQMEERLMRNPRIKKEYEKRLKEDPDLKDNMEKKMAFFREMMRAEKGNRER
jgi:hypothetical protein